MQNTFSQSGNDSKWFLTKIIFQNRYVALETPSRPPPPLHGKCHLKFPFWFFAPLPYRLWSYKLKLWCLDDIHVSICNSSSLWCPILQANYEEFILHIDKLHACCCISEPDGLRWNCFASISTFLGAQANFHITACYDEKIVIMTLSDIMLVNPLGFWIAFLDEVKGFMSNNGASSMKHLDNQPQQY